MNIYKNHKMNRLKTLAGVYKKKSLNESRIYEYGSEDDLLPSAQNFIEVLMTGDNNAALQAFFEFCNDGINNESYYYMMMEKVDANAFQQFLNNNADTLYAHLFKDNKVQWSLAPSLLSEYGIKTPLSYFKYIGEMDMTDEVFGIIYQPNRLQTRFQDGAKNILANEVKNNVEYILQQAGFIGKSTGEMLNDVRNALGDVAYNSLAKRLPRNA